MPLDESDDNAPSSRTDLTSARDSISESDGGQSFRYGFPMPFYLCEHYGGLPLVLREEDASPVEGYVWLDGEAYPVGVKVTDPQELKEKALEEKPSHLEWVMTVNREIVAGLPLMDSEQIHPVLYYLLADDEFYPMACQSNNVPVEGYVHHPDDHSVLIPVGVQHYDEDGKLVPQMVFCMDGKIKSGIPAHPQIGWSTHYIVKEYNELPPGLTRRTQDESVDIPSSTSSRSESNEETQAAPCTIPKTATEEKTTVTITTPAVVEAKDAAQATPIQKMSEAERKVTETMVDVGRSVKEQLANGVAPTPYAADMVSSSDSEDVKELTSVVASSSLDGTRVPDSYLSYDSTRHLTAASGEGSSTGSFNPHYAGSHPTVSSQAAPTVDSSNQEQYLPPIQSQAAPTAPGVIRHTKVLETKVPVVHQQVVEKVVEVKQPTQITTRTVEVPFTEDKILYRPHKQVVDVPVEVVREVRKPINRPVEKIVHVPGHVVEVPKPYPVAKHVPKHIVQTKKQLWRIQESSKPVVVQEGVKEIECIRYEPEITIVDVYIPKKIVGSISQGKQTKTLRNINDLPTPHWNTLVYKCNEALANGAEGAPGVNCLPFIKNHPSGTISVLATNSLIGTPLGAPYLAEPEAEILPTPEGGMSSTQGLKASHTWSQSVTSMPQSLGIRSPSTAGPRVLRAPSSFTTTIKAHPQPLYGREIMPHWWYEQQASNRANGITQSTSLNGMTTQPPIIIDRSALDRAEAIPDQQQKECDEDNKTADEMKTADDFFVNAPEDDVSIHRAGCRRPTNAKCASCWCI